MGKKSSLGPILLRWSKHTATSEVQDPLGTSLRGSTRLASRLLYCITSITPRARYFSFIPWCVFDFQQREVPSATKLHKAISLREQALTLGCVAHHDGKPCPGGALVGSREASKWVATNRSTEADFRRLNFVKNPALDAYYNSLVNLGVIVSDDELPDQDQEAERTFDDIKLSQLGMELAKSYDSCVGRLKAVGQIRSPNRRCSLESLKTWGERGGLCELTDPSAPDRSLLRDLFFCRVPLKGESHVVRRRSLLLILELCRQINETDWIFEHSGFAEAVYFAEWADEGGAVPVQLPPSLTDISTRWRMFYFHYFMAVALEGLFSSLVSIVSEAEMKGESLDSIVGSLSDQHVVKEVYDLLSLPSDSFSGNSTPSQLFACLGVPSGALDSALSVALDEAIRSSNPVAELTLERLLRGGEYEYRSTGLAVSLILLAITLGRYKRWEGTKYGDWFTSAAEDRYLDLIPPIVSAGLSRRFGDWWNCQWHQIADFVLSRYVIQQHQAMSYEKSASGERCILQVHGASICATGSYGKIGIGNPRFHSAVQILVDLGLVERTDEVGAMSEKDILLTKEGASFLRSELRKEAGK